MGKAGVRSKRASSGKAVSGRKGSRVSVYWTSRAYLAGADCGKKMKRNRAEITIKTVNQAWSDWVLNGKRRMPSALYNQAAKSFLRGFCRSAGTAASMSWVLVPTNKTIGAVVTAMNEEKTIASVLQQMDRLPLDEMIVVINGSTDDCFKIARTFASPTIIHYPVPIGHDVGRSIGAKLSQSDILLFVDGDFPIRAEHLAPFITAIERGNDVALNNISPYISLFSARDSVTRFKEFLNKSIGRSDLAANSMTAVPHALSRKAVETIGCHHLLTPPKAQVIAVMNGLKICAPASVDVIRKNRLRGNNVGVRNQVSEMIIGDHLEALDLAMEYKGNRLSLNDSMRKRWFAGSEQE